MIWCGSRTLRNFSCCYWQILKLRWVSLCPSFGLALGLWLASSSWAFTCFGTSSHSSFHRNCKHQNAIPRKFPAWFLDLSVTVWRWFSAKIACFGGLVSGVWLSLFLRRLVISRPPLSQLSNEPKIFKTPYLEGPHPAWSLTAPEIGKT